MQLGNPTNSVYYLSGMPDCPKQLLMVAKELRRAIVDSKVEFNSIAVRGLSGMIVAPILSLQFRKPLSLIRKPKFDKNGEPVEGSHSSRTCEGWVGGGPYIIIDDLIDTGATIDAIVEGMVEGWEQRVRSHLAMLKYQRSNSWPTPDQIKRFRIPAAAEIYRPKCAGIFLHHQSASAQRSYAVTQVDAPSINVPVFGTDD